MVAVSHCIVKEGHGMGQKKVAVSHCNVKVMLWGQRKVAVSFCNVKVTVG